MKRRTFINSFGALGALLASSPALARTSPKAFIDDLRATWLEWRAMPQGELARHLVNEGLAGTTMADLFASVAAAQLLKEADPSILESPEGQAFALELGQVHANALLPVNDWMKAMPRRRRRQLRRVLRDDPTVLQGLADQLADKATEAGQPERADALRGAVEEVQFRVETQDAGLLIDAATSRTDRAVARVDAERESGAREAARRTAKIGAICLGIAAGFAVGGVALLALDSLAGAFLLTGTVVSLLVAAGFFVAALILYLIAENQGARWAGVIADADAQLQLVFQDDGDVWGYDASGAVPVPVWGHEGRRRIELTVMRPAGLLELSGDRVDDALAGQVSGGLSGAFELALA